MKTRAVKIFLVDDHRLFREGLRRLLASDGRFEVVGEAADGEEFLSTLGRSLSICGSSDSSSAPQPLHFADSDSARPRPPIGAGRRLPAEVGSDSGIDLVFMDIDMPGMGGIEATRRAVERWPGLRVVALSMHDQAEFYAPMIAAGAVDFLMKDADFDEVVRVALEYGGSHEFADSDSTLRPKSFGAPEGGGRGAENMRRVSPQSQPEVGSEPLTDREAEVLPLICAGLSTQQIADRLFISKRTVDKHRANILEKTGCKNTASLVVYAVRSGLVVV